MVEPEAFVTVERAAEAEVVIKKSRFIGRVVPVRSVDAAETALAQVREAHKTAKHHCFTYRVGLGVPVERYSDDSEPSGTAGRPILEVVRRKDLRNVLVVVTRYFGGTLLGASGLVRAYTETTAAAVAASPPLHCQVMRKLSIHCDYALFGKLEYQLTQRGHTLVDKVYAEGVQFALWLPSQEVEKAVLDLQDGSAGQANIQVSPPEVVGIATDGRFIHGVV